jgi:hypothetical protein
MVAAVIDAATAADNAAAVNRLNPLIIFVKAVAPATAFLFHHGCARPEERTTIKQQPLKKEFRLCPTIQTPKKTSRFRPYPRKPPEPSREQ